MARLDRDGMEDTMALAKRRLVRLNSLLKQATARPGAVRGDAERAQERVRLAEMHLVCPGSKRKRLAGTFSTAAQRRH